MRLSRERILVTHVGSLPRPDAMLDMLKKRENGEPHEKKAFDDTAAAAVLDAVRKQVAAGIDVVSDGEMSKANYGTYVKNRLTGFSGEIDDQMPLISSDMVPYPELRRRMATFGGTAIRKRVQCSGPVAFSDSGDLEDDLAHLRAALGETGANEGFVNSASPGVVTVFLPNHYYSKYSDYLEAVSAAMREEYRRIVDAGFLLQVDCPDLAMGRHTAFQKLDEKDFLKQAELQAEALNAALDGIPADRLRIHLCWGNYEGPHDHDIPLERILPVLLKTKPQAILFEAANPRHEHDWAIWRDAKLPEDKVLVPGLISSTTNYIEHPELIAQRLERYADIVGRERVIAGADCGFGTSAGFGKVDPNIAFRKLASLAEGAARASKRLWN